MPADSIFIQKLANELHSKLISGRIDKIIMADKSNIMITIRAQGINNNLLITMASQPRCYLTSNKLVSTPTPLAFCVHLRKHIGGGMIEYIEALPFERIIKFSIFSRDELGELRKRHMYIELMGKYSNVVITDENDKITDTLKHISADAGRPILPGFTFVPPKNDSPAPDETITIRSLIQSQECDDLPKALMGITRGIAPLTAKEAYVRNADIALGLHSIVDATVSPTVYYENGQPKDYTFCTYECKSNLEMKVFDSLCEALDEYFDKAIAVTASDDIGIKLTKATTVAIDRYKKKLGRFMQDFALAQDSDGDKHLGELVINNMHTYDSTEGVITAYDWTQDCMQTIKLDEHPKKYAEKCFKRYQKKKRTCTQLTLQIDDTQNQIEYLEGILSTISENTGDKQALEEIELELADANIIKLQKRSKKGSTAMPRSFTINGYKVLVGKSNLQNDKLVKDSRGDDIWMHTQGVHGSHVVINTNGRNIDSTVLTKAGELAAFFSKSRLGENVAVDYTKIKNVKKPRGYPPGKVEYVNQKTIFVNPVAPDFN